MKNPPTAPADSAPERPTGHLRRRSAVLVVAVLPIALLMLAGCGRLRRQDASTRSSVATATTVTTAPVASTSSTAATPGSAAADGSESQTLDSISQQLSAVDSNLNAANGNLQTANSAINSQEGDPSQ